MAVAAGDIRRHAGKQAALREAATGLLDALGRLEANSPESGEAVQAKADARSSIARMMAVSGVRKPAPRAV